MAPTKGNPSDEIILLGMPKLHSTLTSTSPFTAKLELALRMAGLPFRGFKGDVTNKKHAPQHKLPTMWHGEKRVADSSCIIEYLVATYPDQMAVLVPKEPERQLLGQTLLRMLEEHTYFVGLYATFQRDDSAKTLLPMMLADVPWILRSYVSGVVRKSVIRDLYGQGMGRHGWERVLELGASDLGVCERLLSDGRAFLTGASPTLADCFLFGIVDTVLNENPKAFTTAVPNEFGVLIKRQVCIMALYRRIAETYFPSGPSEHWAAPPP